MRKILVVNEKELQETISIKKRVDEEYQVLHSTKNNLSTLTTQIYHLRCSMERGENFDKDKFLERLDFMESLVSDIGSKIWDAQELKLKLDEYLDEINA